jgi:hypothetical protein
LYRWFDVDGEWDSGSFLAVIWVGGEMTEQDTVAEEDPGFKGMGGS